MTTERTHQAQFPETKVAGGYREDDGRYVEEHRLVRFPCSCGWKGVWYATFVSAAKSIDRHFLSQQVA